MGFGSTPTPPPPPQTPQRDDTEGARRRAILAASTGPRTILTDADERTATGRGGRVLLGGRG